MLENISLRRCTSATDVIAGRPSACQVGKEVAVAFRNRFRRQERQKVKKSSEEHRRYPTVPSMITCGPPVATAGAPFHATIDCDDSSEDESTQDDFRICLNLLESEMVYEDSRYGMEGLMKLVNSELVNFKKEGSIAQALVCGTEIGCRSETQRLRRVFLSCFSRSSSFNFYDDGVSSDSSEENGSENGSENSSLTGARRLSELKLPALRILASSLELIAMLPDVAENRIDLSSTFWVSVLGSMAKLTESVTECRVEATLSIKCIRLLRTFQPKTMEPYIRYSLLPYLMHSHEIGKTEGDKMLVRETEKVLKPLGMLEEAL